MGFTVGEFPNLERIDPGATCQDVALVAGTVKDESLCLQLPFKVMAGEPAAFISRAARRA